MAFVCPSSRRAGLGAGSPAFSGKSQTRTWPRLLPAATRRVPRKATAVTQSASHGSVQARAALSKESGMWLTQERLEGLGLFRCQPHRPGAGVVLGPRVDPESRVDGREQVALA